MNDPANDQSSGQGSNQNAANADGKPTELWVMGIGKEPNLAVPIKAMGVRGFANLRSAKGEMGPQLFKRCSELNIGLAITLRWVNPHQDNKDSPPSQREGDVALNRLMQVLSSPQSRELGDHLWIGFYSEIAAGGGMVPFDESDQVLGWASRAADRIHSETPWIHLVGPGLLNVDVLGEDRSTLGPKARQYYDYLDRIIRWDISHKAAIDMHLHVPSVEDAARRVKIVKDYVAKIPGGENTPFVAQEWSPAYYKDRSNQEGVKNTILGIYNVMNQNHFVWCGYAAYYTFEGQPEAFHWENLVNNSDKSPHEPFYSLFKDLAEKVRDNEVANLVH